MVGDLDGEKVRRIFVWLALLAVGVCWGDKDLPEGFIERCGLFFHQPTRTEVIRNADGWFLPLGNRRLFWREVKGWLCHEASMAFTPSERGFSALERECALEVKVSPYTDVNPQPGRPTHYIGVFFQRKLFGLIAGSKTWVAGDNGDAFWNALGGAWGEKPVRFAMDERITRARYETYIKIVQGALFCVKMSGQERQRRIAPGTLVDIFPEAQDVLLVCNTRAPTEGAAGRKRLLVFGRKYFEEIVAPRFDEEFDQPRPLFFCRLLREAFLRPRKLDPDVLLCNQCEV